MKTLRTSTSRRLLSLAAWTCACAAVPAVLAAAPAEYTVRFTDTRIAHVEARVGLRGSSVSMAQRFFRDVPDSWATFVRNLRVTVDGRDVAVEKAGLNTWRLIGSSAGAAVLRYDVVLDHDRLDWDAIAATIAYSKPWCAVATGQALFIGGSDDEGPIRIRFDVPNGWAVQASWRRSPDDATSFTAANVGDLHAGQFVAGRFETFATTVDRFTLTVTLGGPPLVATRDYHQRVITDGFRLARDIFGGVPGDAPGWDDPRTIFILNYDTRLSKIGGAFRASHLSMLQPDYRERPASLPPFYTADELALRLQSGPVHEVLHLWNDGALRRKSAGDLWFSEGFSDYYAFRILRSLGAIGAEQWRRSLALSYKLYRHDDLGRVSARDAGPHWPNHKGLTYNGGHLIAACLDADIRTTTKNAKSLDDAMGWLFARFARHGVLYDASDVMEAVKVVSGKSYGTFFERFIEGTEEIPFHDCLGKAGLDVQPDAGREFAVVPVATPSALQLAVVAGMMGVAP